MILNGSFHPKNPESLYSTVLAEKDGNAVAVAYINVPLLLPDPPASLTYLNATADCRLYITGGKKSKPYACTVFDCQGTQVWSGTCSLSEEVLAIPVPPSGVICLR